MDEVQLRNGAQALGAREFVAQETSQRTIQQRLPRSGFLIERKTGEIDLGMGEIAADAHLLHCQTAKPRVFYLLAQDDCERAHQLRTDALAALKIPAVVARHCVMP